MAQGNSKQGQHEVAGGSKKPSPTRDRKGRFKKGVSGNPHGRPRRREMPPASYEELLANALTRTVEITDADGNKRKGSELERIVENLITRLSDAKPKEALDILERVQALQTMRQHTHEEAKARIRKLLEDYEQHKASGASGNFI